MPRLSQADAELVVRCLERVLEEGKADSFEEERARPISQVLARLRTRVEQGRVAAALPREDRRRRRSPQAPPRRNEIAKGASQR